MNTIVKILCQALITLKFEWQFFPKEMKFKCRTQFNEFEQFTDANTSLDCDIAIEQFMKKSFIKF